MTQIVILRETGRKVAIRPQDFNPKFHDRDLTPRPPEAKESTGLEDAHLSALRREIVTLGGAPVPKHMMNDRRALLARVELLRDSKAEKFIAQAKNSMPEGDFFEHGIKNQIALVNEFAPLEESLTAGEPGLTLVEQYEKLYGKRPVGRYLKDKEWLTRKINERQSQ